MLNENIRIARTSKGLSQEALALRLNVVRQTVSKWEQGRSVPDADLLIALSEALETPVSALLGETAAETRPDSLAAISEQLAVLNLQFARARAARRRAAHWAFLAWCGLVLAMLAALFVLRSPYLGWDYSEPETAVAGTALHGFEWLFVRFAPFALAGGMVGVFCTRKRE